MKPVRYDRHARRRMKERGVKEEEAEMALREPEYTAPSVKERINAFKFAGNRYLRVIFKEESDHFLVITVTIRKKPFKR